MDKKKAETRNKLKEITVVKDFEDVLSRIMLSEEEKEIMRLHYKEKKSMMYIADMLGMSEITVKKKHSKILMKVGKVI